MAGTLDEQLSKIEISCFYNKTAVRLHTLKAQTNERSINRTLFSNRCAAEFITGRLPYSPAAGLAPPGIRLW